VRLIPSDPTLDGGLKVDDGSEDAALQPPLAQRGEEALDGLSHEAEVGMKWKVQRG
jgi:hypothetical protein